MPDTTIERRELEDGTGELVVSYHGREIWHGKDERQASMLAGFDFLQGYRLLEAFADCDAPTLTTDEATVAAYLLAEVYPQLWEQYELWVELDEDDAAQCIACQWTGDWSGTEEGVCPLCGDHALHNHSTTHEPGVDEEYTTEDYLDLVEPGKLFRVERR